MAFLNKYNTDDIVFRNILIGLLDVLNKNIVIEYTISNNEIKKFPIPFGFAKNGDERFMQDFYIPMIDECATEDIKAEGNYDPVPRGVISLSTINIDSSSLTNKFVRGTYNKETDDGNVKAFSAYITNIPLKLSIDATIVVDSLNDSLKIIQKIIETFYMAYSYTIDYKGFRIESRVGFPNDYGIERPLQFSYGEDNKINITFPLQIESMHTFPDLLTERFRGNVMSAIGTVKVEDQDGKTTGMETIISADPE
jgi:hypothetical protein